MTTGNILTSSGFAQTVEVLSFDPAAGANVLYTVPAGEQWELVAAHVSLVTDATAANRRMRLTIDDGTNIYAQVSAALTQAASLTYAYSFLLEVADYSAVRDNHAVVQLPSGLLIPSGHRVQTAVVNLQAGDNIGAMRLMALVRR